MPVTIKEGAGFWSTVCGWLFITGMIGAFIAALPLVIDKELARQKAVRIVGCQQGYYTDEICQVDGVNYRYISRNEYPGLYSAVGGSK